MNNKMRGLLAMTMGMALAADSLTSSVVDMPTEGRRGPRPPKKIIPKGCKEYFFDVNGYLTGHSDDTIFTCYALTDTHAIKKYNKWLKTNRS